MLSPILHSSKRSKEMQMKRIRTTRELPKSLKFYSPAWAWELPIYPRADQEYIDQIRSELPAWYEMITENVQSSTITSLNCGGIGRLEIAIRLTKNLSMLEGMLLSEENLIKGTVCKQTGGYVTRFD